MLLYLIIPTLPHIAETNLIVSFYTEIQYVCNSQLSVSQQVLQDTQLNLIVQRHVSLSLIDTVKGIYQGKQRLPFCIYAVNVSMDVSFEAYECNR